MNQFMTQMYGSTVTLKTLQLVKQVFDNVQVHVQGSYLESRGISV